MRAQFCKTTEALMAENEKVVLLIGDVGGFGLRQCFSRFPARAFNLGAAEQAIVSIAAGFAKEGFYPIIHTFSTFLLRRAYEQVYLDFGQQGLKGLFCGIGEKRSFGPSHICGEDYDLAGLIPGMEFDPRCETPPTLDALMQAAVRLDRLWYARL